MVSIKAFKDGKRDVIVLEGLENINIESIIKDILSNTLNGSYEKISDSEAEPLKEDNIPVIEIPTVFEDGPYQGQTPKEILDVEDPEMKKTALGYLISQKIPENILFSEIERALVEEMNNKLASCEPEAYSQKLTSKQLILFFEMFKGMIPASIMQNTIKCELKDFLDKAEEVVIRNAVKEIITSCRNY